MKRSVPSKIRRSIARWFAPARLVPVRRHDRVRLLVESLEDRSVPATFLVNNIADAGAGSLRDAITQANNSGGPDNIVFDTAGVFATNQVIGLTSGTITISDNVTITSPSAARVTVQRTSGTFGLFNLTPTGNVTMDGLTLSSGNSGSGSAVTVGGTTNFILKNSIVTACTGGTGTIYLPPGY